MELLYVGGSGLQSPTEAAMRVYVCVCVFAEMLLFTPPCVVFSLSTAVCRTSTSRGTSINIVGANQEASGVQEVE